MDIDHFEMELDFSAGNAGQVQQIVDQTRFQLNTRADGNHFFAKLGRKILVFRRDSLLLPVPGLMEFVARG